VGVFVEGAQAIGHQAVKGMRRQGGHKGDVVETVGRAEDVAASGFQDTMDLSQVGLGIAYVLKYVVGDASVILPTLAGIVVALNDP